MVSVRMLLIAVVGALGLASGCEKQIQVTIYNHSDEAKTIRVTTPEETTTVGNVGSAGRLTTVMKVKNSDLPGQCSLAAGPGPGLSFSVTQDSPSKWWFHVTKDGKVTGPYGRLDEHVNSEKTVDVKLPVERTMIIKP